MSYGYRTTYIVRSSHVPFEKLDFLTIESAKSEIEGAHASNFLLTTDCNKEIFNSSKNWIHRKQIAVYFLILVDQFN